MRVHSIDVFGWSRILEDVLIAMVGVHVLDHVVHLLEHPVSIDIFEVFAKDGKYLRRSVVGRTVVDAVHHVFGALRSIVFGRIFIVDPRVIITRHEHAEAIWCTVLIPEHMCKDGCAVEVELWVRLPDKLEFLAVDAVTLILRTEAADEESVEAHLRKEAGIDSRVAKWVDMPADAWLYSKLFENEFVTQHHVEDHVSISWTGLVMHRPASVNDF